MDCSLAGSSVHGILQTRVLEWVAIPFSRGSSQPSDQTQVSCIAGSFLTFWATREARGVVQSLSSESSVAQSCPILWPHALPHIRLPCPSPSPGAYSNSSPLSRWCRPTISSWVVPFSSCLQSFPASGSFLMSQFFALGSQSIEVSASASVLPMDIQDWFHLGLTDLISL